MINETRTDAPTWESVRGYLDATKDAIDHGTTGVAEGLWLALDALHTLMEPPGLPDRLMDVFPRDELNWQPERIVYRAPDFRYLAQLWTTSGSGRWVADLAFFPDDGPVAQVMSGDYSTLAAAKAAVAEALRNHRTEVEAG